MNQGVQDKIIQMYINHVDMDQIINNTKLSEKEIRQILSEKHIDRWPYNKHSEELIGRIIILYQRGESIKQICNKLLLSESFTSKTLDRRNIKKRTSSERTQIYNRNSHYFDDIDTPNKAYILGILYADGCNTVMHKAIHLSLQEEDKSVLDRIKDEIKYEGPLRFNNIQSKNSQHKNTWSLVINDEYMSQVLCEKGVVPAKSLILTFPTCIPNRLLRHFVRGYFDGDGCVWFDEKRLKCQTQTCGTRDVCENILNLMEIIGCKCFISHPKQCKDNTVLVRTAANKASFKFLEWMYGDLRKEDIRMDRKYQTYLKFKEWYINNIKSSVA